MDNTQFSVESQNMCNPGVVRMIGCRKLVIHTWFVVRRTTHIVEYIHRSLGTLSHTWTLTCRTEV